MLNRFKPSSKIFYWPFQGGASFVDHLCYFCLVLLCFHARLFVDALWFTCWERAGLLALFCDDYLWRCHFPISILGQVWCLIALIPDLCPLSYFHVKNVKILPYTRCCSRHFITLPKICKTLVVCRSICFRFVLFSFAITSLKKTGGHFPCCYVFSLFACVLMSLLRGAMGGSVIVLFPGETNLAIWATHNLKGLITIKKRLIRLNHVHDIYSAKRCRLVTWLNYVWKNQRMKHINALYIRSHANVVFNNLTIEALPVVVRNMKKGALISGYMGTKAKFWGEQRRYWGPGNIRKQIFDFGGTNQFISGEQGNRYPHPHKEGLNFRD